MPTNYTTESRSATVVVTIVPIIGRSGRYTVWIGGRLICRSGTPLLDAARSLFASGYSADTIIKLRNVESDKVVITAMLGVVAGLTITDSPGRLTFRNADAAIAASLALRHGCPLEVLRKALSRGSLGRASGPRGAALDQVAEETAPPRRRASAPQAIAPRRRPDDGRG